jgi:DNA-binding response OmpR family regulator
MHKILIVEDQEDLAKGLELHFKKEGFEVLKTRKGETALTLAFKESPSLVLLDVMLPGMSGLDVCRELRHKGFEAPIIMLTAKAEEVDKVVGLELGADDYVTKPFAIRELLARVRSQLRRQGAAPAGDPTKYRFGDVEIDFERFVTTAKSKHVDLTMKEYDILKFLIKCRGEVVTRDRLLTEVWGYDEYSNTRTVDTHILKLRKKLEPDQANPRYILSVYGGGYKFVG